VPGGGARPAAEEAEEEETGGAEEAGEWEEEDGGGEPPPRRQKKKARKPSRSRVFPAAPKGRAKSGKRKSVSLAKGTKRGRYVLPPLSILRDPPPSSGLDEDHLQRMAEKIVEKLRTFRIGAEVVGYSRGPAVTLFELRLDDGVKVGQITAREDDLTLALAAHTLRVVAPLPGKGTVGVEVPNEKRDIVVLKELLPYARTLGAGAELPLFLGRDVMGEPVISDLAKMPHLLIAGATGSGKSVCLNTILLSLLTTRTPDEVGLILVDPKMVELQLYEAIPHLLTPIVTDMTKVPGVLEWAVDEMERRYRHLSLAKVRSLKEYNKLGERKLRERLGDWFDSGEKPTPRRFPAVVVVIDEFADLMVSASKDVELLIQRLAQKSRAVGIHVILATQRPSREVVTGIIKSNLPTRISFKVTSSINSRVVLDQVGAERLIGNGDMLFHPPGTSALVRAQGVYVSDGEIHEVVDWWRRQAKPKYVGEILNPPPRSAKKEDPSQVDPLYEEAVQVVIGEKRGAATLLQRAFKIGYTRASRLIELMEEDGIVGKYVGSKSREVLLTLEEWEARKKKRGA
ncbi:MAG TPA: DNA translocase FtsK, partial [Planctomycetes bacterium]|nr:DNA translocase FtsK [Planctomycetota bacterium]